MQNNEQRFTRVVLDANVIIGSKNNLLEGTHEQILMNVMRDLPFRLAVPEIAILEVVNRRREKLTSLLAKYRKVLTEMASLGDGRVPAALDVDDDWILRTTDAFEARLRERLKAFPAEIIRTPNVGHEQLVKRDLARRKPFNENGGGYRDALIWESILELGPSLECRIIFVTENSRDFGASDRLHIDLESDLKQRRIDEAAIVICNSLTELSEKHLLPLRGVADEVRQKYEAGNLGGENYIGDWWQSAHGGIESRVREMAVIDDKDLSEELGGRVFGGRLESLDENVHSGEPVDVKLLDEKTVYIRESLNVYSLVEFFVAKHDLPSLDQRRIFIEDAGWSDELVLATSCFDSWIALGVIFNLETNEIDNWDVESFGLGRLEWMNPPPD